MRIIDAHTGRDVKVGDVLPIPGHGSTPERSRRGEGAAGWYRVVAMKPGPLGLLLNAVGYLFGIGLEQPKLLIEMKPGGERHWVDLLVRTNHPGFPGQVVAFIPS